MERSPCQAARCDRAWLAFPHIQTITAFIKVGLRKFPRGKLEPQKERFSIRYVIIPYYIVSMLYISAGAHRASGMAIRPFSGDAIKSQNGGRFPGLQTEVTFPTGGRSRSPVSNAAPERNAVPGWGSEAIQGHTPVLYGCQTHTARLRHSAAH